MSEDNVQKVDSVDELDWLKFRKHNTNIQEETLGQKLLRKCKQNPAVPLGTMATVAALTCGLWNFYKGDSLMSQYMMRARVAAQSFTLLSMAVGFIFIMRKESGT
ncbi:HIG1 domain family member 2A, mitochondrial [Xylocopa sonorina]|uniref:HIG1 domain family member 2A, mitochondrial n=1 Tax=Xylocopa sonorina TaxID=1818115 RepID=UPI00403B19E0